MVGPACRWWLPCCCCCRADGILTTFFTGTVALLKVGAEDNPPRKTRAFPDGRVTGRAEGGTHTGNGTGNDTGTDRTGPDSTPRDGVGSSGDFVFFIFFFLV